jgi:hypothetical protein
MSPKNWQSVPGGKVLQYVIVISSLVVLFNSLPCMQARGSAGAGVWHWTLRIYEASSDPST